MCEHEDQNSYYYPDATFAGYMCSDCAEKAGFCPVCEAFVGGIENEFISIRQFGMCSDCTAFFESETGTYEDYDTEGWE